MIFIKVKQGSVVDEDVEAIVCSANNWLVLGSGNAGEINMLGGPSIQIECDKIIEDNKGIPVEIGRAFRTGAGVLAGTKNNLKHVIHAVGMGYKNRNPDDPYDLHDRMLATRETVFDAVANALKIADQLGVQTIAIPLMCARPGYSNLKSEDAPRIMLTTMMNAINSYAKRANSVSRVTICTGTLSISPNPDSSEE